MRKRLTFLFLCTMIVASVSFIIVFNLSHSEISAAVSIDAYNTIKLEQTEEVIQLLKERSEQIQIQQNDIKDRIKMLNR